MNRVYIVAEISANHNQSYESAEQLVYAAKFVGADAVKLQTYTPDTLTIKCDRPEFIIKGNTPWDGRTLYDLYSKAYMPWEWQPKLKKVADSLGIDLFSTAYDRTAVDFLEAMGVSRYKIASFELVDLDLIAYVASTKKPIIMSTGMATVDEISKAVLAAEGAGAGQITLLKCTSSYPTPYSESNLLGIPALAKLFELPVGLSDHTQGIAVPIAAVALGVSVIEKHITLSRDSSPIDGSFSLEPQAFKYMVSGIRIAESAMGSAAIRATEAELGSRNFRRSLFAVEDIKVGDEFTCDNVRSIRPGCGLAPEYLSSVVGRRATCDISRGTPIQWELVENNGDVAQLGERLA